MKKLFLAILPAIAFTAHADSIAIGQFTFNGMLDNYELSQLEKNIQQNNANRVVLTFNGPMLLLANNIKNALLNDGITASVVMENLVNSNSAVYYYGVSNWYSYNVEATVYASDNPAPSTQPTRVQQPNSNDFYDYKNKDNDFYDYDNTQNNQNN